ncbi:putative glycoside hydrolase [Lacrimispora sp.]|uniref:putative glycoside hydrolase n=1 Tax=Lacrimispora sp. TaxID=2719234 RepID=UPI0028ACEBDE|nr:putative glycoside hydrolase [Lacrimispora sp.]
MKRWLLAVIAFSLVTSGCSRYKGISDPPEKDNKTEESQQSTEESEQSTEAEAGKLPVEVSAKPGKKPVKVKGIYISGYMAGSEGLQAILDKIQGTEINTVVIDVKNDDGRITFAMADAPTVNEIGATEKYIKDIDSLMAQLKARGLYTIARVVAFRDPYLAEKKPEWALKNKDGSLHRDNKGLAWVNPYRTEVWDYLVEVGTEASKAGFDEVQFDYIRFSTDSSMKQVVFDEKDTRGRSKTDIITEFIQYAYDKLSSRNVFVSADVFGTIIGSKVDAEAVGQIYQEMACHLDYICPMIYPSHYGDGNFGIDHPDMEPYRTIRAALKLSRQDLESAGAAGKQQAIVRPWLQDFTASYLEHHITYGAKEVRAQIQAVYDAGYDEWILWSASNRYTWDGFLSQEAAKEEAEKLARIRETEVTSSVPTEVSTEVPPEVPSEVPTGVPSDVPPEVQTESKEERTEKSLEGSIAAETEQETKKENKKKTRPKPDVVIVTTGGLRD